MARFGPDALFRKLDNGVGADVDEVDVGEVVDFVVLGMVQLGSFFSPHAQQKRLQEEKQGQTHVLFERWPFQPESMRRLLRGENGSFGGVVDTSLDE